MVNINDTLLRETQEYFSIYDCKKQDVKQFLFHRGEFEIRQKEAIRIIESVIVKHRKEELLRHISELARVEHGIRELEPWIRDHVVHTVLNFILGIYINERFFKPISGIHVNDFQWKLASMFHDIGYSGEIAKDILKPLTNKINDIAEKFNGTSNIFFKVIPIGLDKLSNNVNSFDLIQKQLDEWQIRVDATKEYNNILNTGSIDHGVISSLIILYLIDRMYQKYNPKREFKDILAPGTYVNFNQKYFEKDSARASCKRCWIRKCQAWKFR